METRQQIRSFVAQARRRFYLTRGFEGLQIGLVTASALVLLLIAADRLGIVKAPHAAWIACGAAVLALGIALARAFFPKKSLLSIAAEIDGRAGWKERVSSLLALPALNESMELALEEDVARLVKEERPSRFFALRIPKSSAALPILIGLIAASVAFLPNLDLFGKRADEEAKKKNEDEIRKTVEKLNKARLDLDRPKSDKPMDKAKAAMKKLDELAKQMQEEAPDRKKAMAEINALKDQIRKDKEDLENMKRLAEKLQKLAEQAEKEKGDTGDLGKKIEEGRFHDAAQKLAEIRQKMTQDGLSPEMREALAEQMRKLKDQVAKDEDLKKLKDEMAEKEKELKDLQEKMKPDDLSEEDRKKLAERIQKLQDELAKDRKASDLEKDLDKAMQALKDGKEPDLADLQKALDDLDSAMEESEMLEGVLGDLEEMEGDLAEGAEGECPS